VVSGFVVSRGHLFTVSSSTRRSLGNSLRLTHSLATRCCDCFNLEKEPLQRAGLSLLIIFLNPLLLSLGFWFCHFQRVLADVVGTAALL
jgi:hypothetical protein